MATRSLIKKKNTLILNVTIEYILFPKRFEEIFV